MDRKANRVFISYRRDDAAGYAGRLEEALESRLGRGSVFRDVLDIPPGDDFVAAIRVRLAEAQTQLVLIGPRWTGGETLGQRRIDDANDFVRLEVALALESGIRVVPVLLPGVAMPSESDLPTPLKPLARRNALSLSDANWDGDVARLAQSVGQPKTPRTRYWALGGVATVLIAVAITRLVPGSGLPAEEPSSPTAAGNPGVPAVATVAADGAARLPGTWQAAVKYNWGDRHEERFELKRHAGELTGTASFLGYPRAIENPKVQGNYLHFETHTQQSMDSQTREITHRYSVELRGQPPDEWLSVRMQTSGSFDNNPPLEFEARRTVGAVVPASAAK
jgi:hypothetical protein